MKLLTQKIKQALPKLYSTDGIWPRPIIVKFFTPWTYWTWYIVEGELQEDGDWRFFGYVDGHVKEWGYVSLRELESIKGPFGLQIERDLHFDNVSIDKHGNIFQERLTNNTT
jgi:hypothetical protein